MATSEDILSELKLRVELRRQEGKYPLGLEEQLEAQFNAIMEVVHRGHDVLGDVERLLNECAAQVKLLDGRVSSKSRIPGFGLVHFLLGKLFGRQTTAIAAQVRSTLEKQQLVLELLMKQLQIQQGTDVRVLNQLSSAMVDRLMMVDVLAQSILELEHKVNKGS